MADHLILSIARLVVSMKALVTGCPASSVTWPRRRWPGPSSESNRRQAARDLEGLHGGRIPFCLHGQHQFPRFHAPEFKRSPGIGRFGCSPSKSSCAPRGPRPLNGMAKGVLDRAGYGETGGHGDDAAMRIGRAGRMAALVSA